MAPLGLRARARDEACFHKAVKHARKYPSLLALPRRARLIRGSSVFYVQPASASIASVTIPRAAALHLEINVPRVEIESHALAAKRFHDVLFSKTFLIMNETQTPPSSALFAASLALSFGDLAMTIAIEGTSRLLDIGSVFPTSLPRSRFTKITRARARRQDVITREVTLRIPRRSRTRGPRESLSRIRSAISIEISSPSRSPLRSIIARARIPVVPDNRGGRGSLAAREAGRKERKSRLDAAFGSLSRERERERERGRERERERETIKPFRRKNSRYNVRPALFSPFPRSPHRNCLPFLFSCAILLIGAIPSASIRRRRARGRVRCK